VIVAVCDVALTVSLTQSYNNIRARRASSCGKKKSEHAPPSREEQRALEILRADPQMRAVFIARIAPPIANKMVDCAMIP
jgi:hypothetical protein